MVDYFIQRASEAEKKQKYQSEKWPPKPHAEHTISRL
jgi:hypothetical protein